MVGWQRPRGRLQGFSTHPVSSFEAAVPLQQLLLLLLIGLQCYQLTGATAGADTAGPSSRQPAVRGCDAPHCQSTLARFLRSSALGATHCALPATMWDGEEAQVHAWIRLVLIKSVSRGSHTARHRLLVKGYAMVQGARTSIPVPSNGNPQMTQAKTVREHFKEGLALRSAQSGQTYQLQAAVIRRRMRGDHVIDVWGNISLHERDAGVVDFELRVTNVSWHCLVLAEQPAIRARAAPPADSKHNDQAVSAVGRSLVASGGQEATDSGLTTWTHHLRASYTHTTEVWAVLSPFSTVAVQRYVQVLLLHMAWHATMGVDRYLLYVKEHLTALLLNPTIQALVASGRLVLVLYDDLPQHESRPLRPRVRDGYLTQTLAYNSALLALWGADALAFVVDIDEFVLTPTPTTLRQLLCDRVSPPAGRNACAPGLRIKRFDTTCRQGVPADKCNPRRLYNPKWGADFLGLPRTSNTTNRVVLHPVGYLTADLNAQQSQGKVLADPNAVRDVWVHTARPVQGKSSILPWADQDCALLLHYADLWRHRTGAHARQAQPFAPPHQGDWWWPLKAARATPWAQ